MTFEKILAHTPGQPDLRIPIKNAFDGKLADAIPSLMCTLCDEVEPLGIGYFLETFDLFLQNQILTLNPDVASMICKA